MPRVNRRNISKKMNKKSNKRRNIIRKSNKKSNRKSNKRSNKRSNRNRKRTKGGFVKDLWKTVSQKIDGFFNKKPETFIPEYEGNYNNINN